MSSNQGIDLGPALGPVLRALGNRREEASAFYSEMTGLALEYLTKENGMFKESYRTVGQILSLDLHS